MSERYLERNADPLENFTFGRWGRHAVVGHRGERTEIQLQEALAREEALLQQMVGLSRQLGALTELLGSGSDAMSRIASLTPRERQIMALILAGHPNKNIAADIGISQRTIENHRASIMRKTGSKCLPALAKLALAALWYRAREPKSLIGLITPALEIEERRDNDNSRIRRCSVGRR